MRPPAVRHRDVDLTELVAQAERLHDVVLLLRVAGLPLNGAASLSIIGLKDRARCNICAGVRFTSCCESTPTAGCGASPFCASATPKQHSTAPAAKNAHAFVVARIL